MSDKIPAITKSYFNPNGHGSTQWAKGMYKGHKVLIRIESWDNKITDIFSEIKKVISYTDSKGEKNKTIWHVTMNRQRKSTDGGYKDGRLTKTEYNWSAHGSVEKKYAKIQLDLLNKALEVGAYLDGIH